MTEQRVALHQLNTIPASNGDRPHDSWQPYYLGGVPDQPTITPTLGYGLIYPGFRHVFSGPPESAKTLAAYAIALNICREHPDRHIVLMDFEMGPRATKRRFQDLGATPQQLNQQILYLEPQERAALERILIIAALQPALVIIDAAAGAFDNEDLDDNSRRDAEKWRKLYLDPFFDAGVTTILIDHVVKNAENRKGFTIGSERKIGGVEVHYGFDTVKQIRRGSTGIYKIILHRDREGHQIRGHIADLHLESHPETHHIDLEFRPVEPGEHQHAGDVWMPTILMEKLSRILQDRPDPISRNQLELSVSGNAEKKRDAIDHLVRLGYATEHAGPRGARTYTTTRPFTVSEWENQPDPPLRPTSSPLRPDEVTTTSSLRPPLQGDETRSTDERRPHLVQDEDPEVAELLSRYGLEPEPRTDWIDELTPTPNDDLPI